MVILLLVIYLRFQKMVIIIIGAKNCTVTIEQKNSFNTENVASPYNPLKRRASSYIMPAPQPRRRPPAQPESVCST